MIISHRPSPNRTIGRQGHIPDIIVCHITDGGFPGSINWVTNPKSQVSYHFMVSRSGEITQCVDIKDTAWANGTDNAGGNRDNRHSQLEAVRARRINANLYTVSIGFEGVHSVTEGKLAAPQVSAAAELINFIRDKIARTWPGSLTQIGSQTGRSAKIPLTKDHIVGHVHITPRHRPNCPGALFPFAEIIRRLRAADQLPGLPMGLDELMTAADGLANIADHNSGLPTNPAPAAEVAQWAAEAWQWAKDTLRMDGTRPRDNITRQEAVVLLYRLYQAGCRYQVPLTAASENTTNNDAVDNGMADDGRQAL